MIRGGGGTEVFGTGFVFAETQTDLKIQRILFQSCRYEECILACMDSVVGSMTFIGVAATDTYGAFAG